jgi:hypothetical protein
VPRVTLSGGYEVEAIGAIDNRICENTFWFVVRPELPPPPSELDITTAVGNWYRDQVVPLLSRDYTYLRAFGTRFVGRAPPTAQVDYTDVAGGFDSESCPANVAYRVNLRVAVPPGRRKGCIFIPAVPVGVIHDNRAADEWRAGLVDAFSVLIDLAAVLSLRWVVVARVLNGAPRIPVVPLRVDFIEVGVSVTSQRKSRLNPGHIIPP